MAHGDRTLAGMRAGLDPVDALAQSLALDESPQVRQVGAVHADGAVAVHTGDGCIPYAGHVRGAGFSAQANMMANPGVPEAMAEVFTATLGQALVDRLLAALEAAEEVGGDIRGRQSAALIVAARELTGDPLVDRIVDVRVDDSPEPLSELRRLATLAVANQRLDVADALMSSGDLAGAAVAYREATDLAPDYLEFWFWQAAAMADAGDEETARAAWTRILASGDEARWGELLRRTVECGLLTPRAVEVLLPG
jgi:uncharacterized Ntn-hydrolase superfamily protein